MNKTARL